MLWTLLFLCFFVFLTHAHMHAHTCQTRVLSIWMLMVEPVWLQSFTCQSARAEKYNPREEIITCCRTVCASVWECVLTCGCSKDIIVCPAPTEHSRELAGSVHVMRQSATRWDSGAGPHLCRLCCFVCSAYSQGTTANNANLLSFWVRACSVRTVMPIIKRRVQKQPNLSGAPAVWERVKLGQPASISN